MLKTIVKSCSITTCFIILSGCMVSSTTPHTRTTVAILPAVPPPVFRTQPSVIVIDTVPDVYYIEDHFNMFFYVHSWYYYCDDRWFVSQSHNGPWTYIETHRLPGRLGKIPPGHLRQPPGQMKPKRPHPKTKPPGQKKDNQGVRDKGKGEGRDGVGQGKEKDKEPPGQKKKDKDK